MHSKSYRSEEIHEYKNEIQINHFYSNVRRDFIFFGHRISRRFLGQRQIEMEKSALSKQSTTYYCHVLLGVVSRHSDDRFVLFLLSLVRIARRKLSICCSHGIRSFFISLFNVGIHTRPHVQRPAYEHWIYQVSFYFWCWTLRKTCNGRRTSRRARVYSLDKIKSCELSIVCVAMHVRRSPFVDWTIIIFMRLREDYPIQQLKLKRILCVRWT